MAIGVDQNGSDRVINLTQPHPTFSVQLRQNDLFGNKSVLKVD